MKKIISLITKVTLTLILLSFLFSSCHTNRKCNGVKGVKTPMGLM